MAIPSLPITYGAAALGSGLTERLAAFLAGVRFENLPAPVLSAARRGVLDWIGCAIAGSRHPSVDILVRTLSALGAAPAASVIARGTRVGPLEAALANGQMGHVLDFDDTHMGGVVLHASSPILSALFALAERRPLSGRDLIAAYAVGFEAGVRAGQAAPDHHAGGWHLTGTLGSIAAGAASARALGLDAQRLSNALAIAATQACGMQQNRGTMSKSFHAGKAASNGLMAGLLAEQGFDGSNEILEGRRGFCRIYSARTNEEALVDGLGTRWEITRNGHKPYACGVVLHPTIDAMIVLAGRGPSGDEIDAIEIVVNPAAVAITGVVDPESGLKSKFSITHTAAVSYLDQAAGTGQFSNERAAGEDVRALAAKVRVSTDDALARDQAIGTLIARDGSRSSHRIDHAKGTVGNPMSDEDIADKFLANAAPMIGESRARDLVAAVDDLADLADAAVVIRLAA